MPCIGEVSFEESADGLSCNKNCSEIQSTSIDKNEEPALCSAAESPQTQPLVEEDQSLQNCVAASTAITPSKNGNDLEQERTRTLSVKSSSSSSHFNELRPLPGEVCESEFLADLNHCQLFLTKYRIIIVTVKRDAVVSIPLLCVESIESKDINGINILCKDGRVFRIMAENNETALTVYKKLTQLTCAPRAISDVFAFQFYLAAQKGKSCSWIHKDSELLAPGMRKRSAYDALQKEFSHLGLKGAWRISSANENFCVCATYPNYLIVPSGFSDEELITASSCRFYNRLPTLVWRSKRTGAVLLRSSQPSVGLVGFFGTCMEADVNLYNKVRTAINNEYKISFLMAGYILDQSKFLFIDARSYTAAWANRTKGGGFEATDNYPNASIDYMGLPNIHNIRYSFTQLRLLLNSNVDQNTYLQTLQSTLWLQNIICLFNSVDKCLNALCFEGRSVLVHCSDGWDRTTQIVCLCMLIADPFYRTFDGFETLIQRQWIDFGHKFGERSGALNGDPNEYSPIFLQFLDCVYQLWMKNPDSFEFNRRYLMKLMQHTYSGLFSSFLFNSVKEATDVYSKMDESMLSGSSVSSKSATPTQQQNGVSPLKIQNSNANGSEKELGASHDISLVDVCELGAEVHHTVRAFSIWQYLGKHNHEFVNPAFVANGKEMLLAPRLMSELELWRDAYCCTPIQMAINNPQESLSSTTPTANVAAANNHDSTASQPSTLSRSQSATSLTSLEQSVNAIQPLYHPSSYYSNLNSHCSSTNTSFNGGGVISASFTQHTLQLSKVDSSQNLVLNGLKIRNFLNVDGLSHVPIVFEDRVVQLHREFLRLEVQARRASEIVLKEAAANSCRAPPTICTGYTGENVCLPTTTYNCSAINNGTNGASNLLVGHPPPTCGVNNYFPNNGIYHPHPHYHNHAPAIGGVLPTNNVNSNNSNVVTLSNGLNGGSFVPRRVRNESIDSSSFGFEVIDEFEHHCCSSGESGKFVNAKRKHDSSGNSSSCSTNNFTPLNSVNECCSFTQCNGCKAHVRTRVTSMTSANSPIDLNGYVGGNLCGSVVGGNVVGAIMVNGEHDMTSPSSNGGSISTNGSGVLLMGNSVEDVRSSCSNGQLVIG